MRTTAETIEYFKDKYNISSSSFRRARERGIIPQPCLIQWKTKYYDDDDIEYIESLLKQKWHFGR